MTTAMETSARIHRANLSKGNLYPGSNRTGNYNDEWYTPPHIVDALGSFDLDPCAGPMRFAAQNLARRDDGLNAQWSGRVWLNPPYSNIHQWIEKFQAHGNGIAIVNARTETIWLQGLLSDADGMLWLRGRVRFAKPHGKSGPTTVGSVLVAYGRRNALALRRSQLPGIYTEVKA